MEDKYFITQKCWLKYQNNTWYSEKENLYKHFTSLWILFPDYFQV